MTYLLDTNTCVRYLNGRVPQVRLRVLQAGFNNLSVSVITKAELFYGSAKSHTPTLSRQKQESFLRGVTLLNLNDAIIDHYAVIRAMLDQRGTPIGPMDLFIAGTALAHNLTLITHNTAEFGRVPGLQMQDWET